MRIALIYFLFLWFSYERVLGQNVPTGSAIPGVITNTHTMHAPFVLGSGGLVNYVVTFEPQYPITDATLIIPTLNPGLIKMSTTYLDGFARNMETISRANCVGSDLITPFDNKPSANTFSYLPYAVSPSDVYGALRTSPFSEQYSYYNGLFPTEMGSTSQNTAVQESQYQSDPVSRSVSVFSPGKSNVGQFNGTTSTIGTNLECEVRLWKIDPSYMYNLPTSVGCYSPGSLVKKTIVNSDGTQAIEFYDNEGKLVCRKVKVDASSTMAITYFVYDVFDRPAYTIHPRAVEYMSAVGSWVLLIPLVSILCDYVIYDNFGRVVEKHKAGEDGHSYFVYDNHNRLIMSASSKDFNNSTWWWNHYDKLNRVIETGSYVLTSSMPRFHFQNIFDHSSLPALENVPSSLLYYLFHESQQGVYPAVALSNASPYTYGFYDDYSHSSFFDGVASTPISFTYNPSVFTGHISTGPLTTAPPSVASIKTKGMLVYSASRVVKPYPIASIPDFISSANYYDDRGRTVEIVSKNIHGDKDYFATQYDFKGRILNTIQKYNNHDCSLDPFTTIRDRYTYSASYGLRLSVVRESINGSDEKEVVSYAYNNLGQVSVKSIGGIETQDLTYNIRGQLKGINANYAESGIDGTLPITFGESIKYDAGFTNNRFCGNIAGIIFRSAGERPQAYGYTYDKAGRLTQADYRMFTTSWNNTTTDYSEKDIQYDLNGNITSLKRYGPLSSGVPGIIDNLTFNYESYWGNRLQSVSDAIPMASTSFTDYDFKDLNTTTVDHTYDVDGNLVSDLNKSVTTTYYHFNKPKTRIFGSPYSGQTDYVYDASGNKLREISNYGSTITTTDYSGNIVYKNNSLNLIYNQEGYSIRNYAAATGSGFDYFYFIRDHLGNVRNVLHAEPVEDISGSSSGGASYMVYHAGHETGDAPVENMIFDNIEYVRDDKPGVVAPSVDLKAARLDAAHDTTTIGTTLVLKVMAGDSFAISAQSYYSGETEGSGVIDSTQFISSILSTLVHGTGALSHPEASHIADVTKLFSPENIGIFNATCVGTVDSSIPLAFINYLMYDENFNIIPENCGRIQISPFPDVWGPITSGGRVGVPHSGYAVIYATTATMDASVYIDPIDIYYYRGALVDINHYYPYGLAFNKSTTSPMVENIHLYQTTKQDKINKLYLDNFGARQYDPQLGRFQSIDAMNQFPSGYTGMGNEPAGTVDPTGNIDDWFQSSTGTISYFDRVGDFTDASGILWNDIGRTIGQNSIDGSGTPFYYKKNDYNTWEYSLYGDENGQLSVTTQDVSITGYAPSFYHHASPGEVRAAGNLADAMALGLGAGITLPIVAGLSAELGAMAWGGLMMRAPQLTTIGGATVATADKIINEEQALVGETQRAFHSGAGTSAHAISSGFQTLSQTRAGQNLMELTKNMPFHPGSQAYNMWARLSQVYARGVPEGSTVNAFLNNPSPNSIWIQYELPILMQKNVTIIPHVIGNK